jgi:hypothetical protein
MKNAAVDLRRFFYVIDRHKCMRNIYPRYNGIVYSHASIRHIHYASTYTPYPV